MNTLLSMKRLRNRENRLSDIPELIKSFEAAGFKSIRHEEMTIDRIPIDMTYLEKVKKSFVSTFYLLPEDEFNPAIEKLESFIKNNEEPLFREWRGTMIYGEK